MYNKVYVHDGNSKNAMEGKKYVQGKIIPLVCSKM